MGTLYIVSTPIGNLKDITLRALEILKIVDYIICEDTRVTGKLLQEYDIVKKMTTLNDFNELKRLPQFLADLNDDRSIALVSDAGTPLISDPGFKLVREAISCGIKIETIPGPSAVIAALTLSGLAVDKFLFVGYLPKKDGKRKELLRSLEDNRESVKSTIVAFESPYRLVESLKNIRDVFGELDVVICRELTKLHQEVRREGIGESIAHFSSSTPKGEFVIIF